MGFLLRPGFGEARYGDWEGQEIAAKNYFRPRLASVAARYAARFPHLDLIDIDAAFDGWQAAQMKHFSDGGIFDQILQSGR